MLLWSAAAGTLGQGGARAGEQISPLEFGRFVRQRRPKGLVANDHGRRESSRRCASRSAAPPGRPPEASRLTAPRPDVLQSYFAAATNLLLKLESVELAHFRHSFFVVDPGLQSIATAGMLIRV